jgi:hypothetical protein
MIASISDMRGGVYWMPRLDGDGNNAYGRIVP